MWDRLRGRLVDFCSSFCNLFTFRKRLLSVWLHSILLTILEMVSFFILSAVFLSPFGAFFYAFHFFRRLMHRQRWSHIVSCVLLWLMLAPFIYVPLSFFFFFSGTVCYHPAFFAQKFSLICNNNLLNCHLFLMFLSLDHGLMHNIISCSLIFQNWARTIL